LNSEVCGAAIRNLGKARELVRLIASREGIGEGPELDRAVLGAQASVISYVALGRLI
jgi:hypothetical protein